MSKLGLWFIGKTKHTPLYSAMYKRQKKKDLKDFKIQRIKLYLRDTERIQTTSLLHTHRKEELLQGQWQTYQAVVQTRDAGCCLTSSLKQVVQTDNQQKISLCKMTEIQILEDSAGWHLDFVQTLGSGSLQMLGAQLVLKVQCHIRRMILEAQGKT